MTDPCTGRSRLSDEALKLLRSPPLREARRIVQETDDRTLREQVELTEIPAPPFGEEERGARMGELMDDAGLESVRADEAGNVLGEIPGEGADEPLVLSAHLDTVFPVGTDVEVRRRGTRFRGPGISDDGRGLAALLAVARALVRAGVEPGAPLLFAATVGEEGVGDLRGVKHLFRDNGSLRARGFISLDGAGMRRLVTRGLGSRRLRVRVRGTGGHSWSDRGTANPIHALGRAVARLGELEVPGSPPTSLTTARWGGGTSINAIPEEAWVELDLRSEDPEILGDLEERVREILREGADVERGRASPDRDELRLEVAVIGDRPPGATPDDDPLVRAAVGATRCLGETPELVTSSTDANIPMARGIPALTMGAGGRAGQAHTTDEWYSNEGGPEGIVRALYTALLATELATHESAAILRVP